MTAGRPPRVLWLIKGLNRGGAERLVTTVATRLDPDRVEVTVAYVLEGADDFAADVEAAGLETICLGGRSTVDRRWLSRLRVLLRTGGFQLIHTHSPVVAVAARLLAPRGTPIVHTEHNLWGAYHPVTRVANALTYGRNAHVFAVSDGVRGSIEPPKPLRSRQPPVETVLHGVDAMSAPRGRRARERAREAMRIADDRPVIGNVANLSPKKDQSTLLRAFASVRRELPTATLVIVGDGPLRGQLEAEIRELGVGEHVRLLGSRDDVFALLPGFDVFTLSSLHEGLPISLLEAMAAEVACVVTAVGGIPEAARDGIDAVLVPARSADRLADALVAVLVSDAERGRLGSAGRDRVQAAFSIDGAIDRTTELYGSLLTGADR